MLATTTVLLGIALAPLVASQSKPTSKPHKSGDEIKKQAQRWVTFLELDDKRAEAADALLRLGPDAVPALTQALNNPRPVVIQRVCHILRFGSHAHAAKKQLIALSRSRTQKIAEAARYALAGIQPAGITLVVDWPADQVVEWDKDHKVVRTLTGVNGPCDAERLPNGNYLICGMASHKVVEMTADGDVVWSFAKVTNPWGAQRLPNGNTLIADTNGGRVLEVDRKGKVAWKYDRRVHPLDAERLVNGNTLIVDGGRRKSVIEISPNGKIIWHYKHNQRSLDADRLPNGNTLIALYKKVIEVTPEGKVVWELKGLNDLHDADRLSNGHTLIGQQNEVAEYDTKGKKLWSKLVRSPAEVQRY